MSESDTIRETAEAILIHGDPDEAMILWGRRDLTLGDLKALARAYLEQVENQQRTRKYLRPYIDNVRLD